MAIVPINTENVQMTVSSPVPVRGREAAGLGNENLASVAEQLGRAGRVVKEEADKHYNMAQENLLMESRTQVENAHKEAFAIAKQKAAPDGSDLYDKFQEELSPLMDNMGDTGLTSDEAKNRLASYQNAVGDTFKTHLALEQLELMEKHNYDGAKRISDQSVNRIMANPTSENIAAEQKFFGGYLDNISETIGPTNTDKLRQYYLANMAEGAVNGYMQQGAFGKAYNLVSGNQVSPDDTAKLDPDMAYESGFITQDERDSLINQGDTYDVPLTTSGDKVRLTTEVSRMMDSMDPDKRARYSMHLIDKMREKSQTRISQVNAEVASLKFVALHGGTITDEDINPVIEKINSASGIDPTAKRRKIDELLTSRTANNLIQSLGDTPRSKWASKISSFDEEMKKQDAESSKYDSKLGGMANDPVIRANRMEMKLHVDSYDKSLEEQQNKDAATASMADQNVAQWWKASNASPASAQRYAAETLSRQAYLEIPNAHRAILPKDEAQVIGDMLKASPNSEAFAETVNKIQAKWGTYAPQVFHEIAGKDKGLDALRMASYADPNSRMDLMDAIKNQEVNNKAFEASPSKKVASETFSDEIRDRLKPYTAAVVAGSNDSSNLSFINGAHEAMLSIMKRDYNKGETDEKALADRAFNTVIGKNYQIIPARNSQIIAPRVIDGAPVDQEKISKYINSYSDELGLKQLGLQVRDDVLGKYKNNPDAYYSDLANKLRWVQNSDQSGVQLKKVEMSGRLTPVFNKYGKPVIMTFKEMMVKPPDKTMPKINYGMDVTE